MTDGEIKGQMFLEYVGRNLKKLRKNLRKNITFDDDLFDDIFQDSIIKVYNSIVKNNKTIDDYEQYFFTSSKFNYILKQNSERERLKKCVNIEDYLKNGEIDIKYEPYVEIDTNTITDEVREIIEEKFGRKNTDLYFDYMKRKIEGSMSYIKYSEITGIPISKISDIISKIKQYTRKNSEIIRLSHALDN